MKDETNTEKRERKLKAWTLLRDGELVTHVAEKTGFNKGTVSRWKRSTAFAVWSANSTSETKPVLEYNATSETKVDDTISRGRFLQALRLTGRIDVATAFSGASKESVIRWMMSEKFDSIQAHAEPFMRAAQVIRNVMEGRDAQGRPADVRPADQLRAAEKYLSLMDWRNDIPHLRVDINAGTAAIKLEDGGSRTPLAIMIDSMKEEFIDIAESPR